MNTVQLKLMDQVVNSASLLTGGKLECIIAHRRISGVTTLGIILQIDIIVLQALFPTNSECTPRASTNVCKANILKFK